MSSIPISQLNEYSPIKSVDFVPIVNSASLTTFRTGVSSIGTYIANSGSVPSASWASASTVSTYSTSASFASASLFSLSASFASRSMWTTSASFASQSLSASWAPVPVSASFASQSISASFASNSTSASWAPVPATSSWAINAISASWASQSVQSVSSSYAVTSSVALTSLTASYVPPTASPGAAAAWALVILPAANVVATASCMFQYNVANIRYVGGGIVADDPAYHLVSPTTKSLSYNFGYNYIVTLAQSMSNNRYIVTTAYYSGYDPDIQLAGGVFNPFSVRSRNEFTISFAGGSHDSTFAQYSGWFMVYGT